MTMARWARNAALLLTLTGIAGCTTLPTREASRGAVFVMGDDLVASPALAAALEDALQRPVVTAARAGARMTHPLPFEELWREATTREVIHQYAPAAYTWVVVTGGANDLRRECRCRRCDDTLDEMVGLTGRGGALPDLVTRITQGGARVLMLGYAPVPTNDGCRDDIRALNNRFSRMADVRVNVDYVSAANRITPETPGYYEGDGLSPSGAAALADLIADTIRDLP